MTFTNLLIAIAAFVLFLVILSQVGKVSELISGASKSEDEEYEESSSINGVVFLLVGFIGMALIVWSYFSQSDKYLPPASSELGRAWDYLFYTIFTPPILLIFFITHILLFWFIYKYRYKKGRKATYFAHSNKLEIIWTVVPLVTMIFFGAITLPKWAQATAKPGPDALHIKVTGQQFKWHIAYPGEDNTFGNRNIREYGSAANILGLNPMDEAGYDDVYSDLEIVVPVNREIAFDLSALDVLHDFYLPHFRVKMDCVPGVPTRIKIIPDRTTEDMREYLDDPTFNYEVACAELCGNGHYNMRRQLRVVEQDEFDAWIAEQKTAKDVFYTSLIEAHEKEQEKMKTAAEAASHGGDHSTDSHSSDIDANGGSHDNATTIDTHDGDIHDTTEIHSGDDHDTEIHEEEGHDIDLDHIEEEIKEVIKEEVETSIH